MTDTTDTTTAPATSLPHLTPPAGTGRRKLIMTAGAACLVGGGLVACGGGASDGDGDSDGDSGTAASADSGSSSAAAGTTVVAVADAALNKAVPAKIGGQDALVVRTGDSTAVAFSTKCPHQGCAVAQNGTEFACPCHGSTFKLDTGDVINGPATSGLTAFDVKVDGDNIVTA